MANVEIDNVISDLIFIREKLHNGIFGEMSTPALTNAISYLRELKSLKASETTEVRHGYWIVVGRTEGGSNILQCSACKKIRRGIAKTAYCKDCGAKMKREKE